MGVYITGMEMPKNCEECQCSYWTEGVHHDYCQAVGYDTEIHYGEKDRPQWCPLIEIPEPHGRLIDADALNYSMLYKENWMRGTGIEAPAVWRKDIDAAPTIIPASEEAE